VKKILINTPQSLLVRRRNSRTNRNLSNIMSFYFSVFLFVCLFLVATLFSDGGRRGGLMVSALDSGSTGLGSSPGRGHCVVFLDKTLYSHGASHHPGV